MTPCLESDIVPPTLLDQTYFVLFPTGSYDAPAFIIEPICVLPISYSNTVTTNNFIVDNGGSGKYLEWATTDDTNIASYTVTISAVNVCLSVSESYTLDVRSTCEAELL